MADIIIMLKPDGTLKLFDTLLKDAYPHKKKSADASRCKHECGYDVKDVGLNCHRVNSKYKMDGPGLIPATGLLVRKPAFRPQ